MREQARQQGAGLHASRFAKAPAELDASWCGKTIALRIFKKVCRFLLAQLPQQVMDFARLLAVGLFETLRYVVRCELRLTANLMEVPTKNLDLRNECLAVETRYAPGEISNARHAPRPILVVTNPSPI